MEPNQADFPIFPLSSKVLINGLLSSRPYSCSLIFKARSKRSRWAEDQHGPTWTNQEWMNWISVCLILDTSVSA